MTESGASDLAELAKCNVRFGVEEAKEADGAAFFEDVLDARLCFRRRDGSIADRKAFIDGLGAEGNSTELLTTELLQVQVLGEQAFVEALVRLKGCRGGNRADGVYRNLRLFERQADRWRCVMWFNKKVGELESEPVA